MVFLDDNAGNSSTEKKKIQRLKYLDSCLKEFIEIYPQEVFYDPNIAKDLNTVYWELIFPIIRSKMSNPNNRVDHHKIISGSQATIMMCCLLRSRGTEHIPLKTRLSKENKDVLELNSHFALFTALNILEQWNDRDVSILHNRSNFLREHKSWLQNVIVLNEKDQTSFPFFAVSQVWYLAEELCKMSSKKDISK